MRRWGWLWLAAWAAGSAAWCVTAGRALGPTYDEPFYLEAGVRSWHRGHHKELLAVGTMPLPAKVETLPLVLSELLQGPPLELPSQIQEWLPVARLGTLGFWCLLLLAGYLGGRLWGGEVAGWLAVAFLAVEPILLGHASLATTDLAFTSCLVLLVVAFKAGRDGPRSRRLILPGMLCGLTILAKASALVFVPVVLVAVEAEHRWLRRRASQPVPWRQSLGDLIQSALGGLLLVFLVCPRALRGLRYQVLHNTHGHGLIYLLGQTSPSGFWYYFAATLAIKMSLAVLLLLALFLARPRYLVNGPLLAAGGLVLLSPGYQVQIGVRFVLPVVALAILGLAVALARWLAECRSLAVRKLSGGGIGLALAWTLAQAVLVWPQGLCYTNELFGGTARGYLALSDSNYDWGQGVPELARWQQQHGLAPLDVWYFGTDRQITGFPFRLVNAGPAASLQELQAQHRGRYLAVSTSLLYQYEYSTPGAKILRERAPDARTTTFLIYDFSDQAGAATASAAP
jgi:hypothetical protein